MGRLVFFLFVLAGIGYGAWSVLGPDKARVPLAADEGASARSAPRAEAPSPPPATPDADVAAGLTREAEALLKQAGAAGSREAAIALKDRARGLLWEACLNTASPEGAAALTKRVAALNEEVLFSEEPVEGKFFLYEFQAGDRLWTLCYKRFPTERKVRVEPGFLLWMNGVADARKIREGQILKVPTEELSLLVRKSQFRLWVLLGGIAVRDFPVGIGANDKTPEGLFEIETKIEKPDWYAEGRKVAFGHPDNPLGTRWMGFKRTRKAAGYGIHGTDEPESVGRAVSQGCVRMRNSDVEELFGWVPPGAKVHIVR